MDFETFEKIYRSRAIIHKMLRLRGYSLKKFENQTKEELNILFQNHQKKINYDIDSLDMMLEKDGNKLLVKYILSERVKSSNLEKLVETMYEETLTASDTLILITKDYVLKTRDSNKSKSSLEEYLSQKYLTQQKFIQIFWLNALLFDITESELTPSYTILNEEEKQKVLDRYHVTEDKIENVLFTDPLANFYGVKIGNMVKAVEVSETNGFNTFYKLCIA
jgi:DNA-directed RNA polymerase subunit H (RpoH/RPB5)